MAAVAAATPMAPLPGADLTLNLSSPRIRAAMRVLGITPKEVAKLDPATPAFADDADYYKLCETRRQNTIETVKRKALDSPEMAKFDMGGDTREARNRAFAEQVKAAEEANMAMMKKIAKKDTQKFIIQELETKACAAQGKKRMEEGQRRLKDLKKVLDDELAARKKEGLKKQEKSQEVRVRAAAALEEHQKEMKVKIDTAQARALKQLEGIAQAHEEQRQHGGERHEMATIRRQDKAETDQVARETMYRSYCSRHAASASHLEDLLNQRESNVEMIAEKHRRTVGNIKAHAEAKQAQAEAKYFEIAARHESASKVRDEEYKTRKDFFVKHNAKRFTTHASRYSSLLEEFEKNPGMKMTVAEVPGSPKFLAAKAEKWKALPKREPDMALIRSQTHASIFAEAHHRRNFVEIAKTNRERLRRAHHYSVEQQLDKLSAMRQKVQIMENAKVQADKQRTQMVSKCAREKMHTQDKVDRIKNSSNQDKMYGLLDSLDPDPEAVHRINELLGQLDMQKLGGFKDTEEEGK